VVILESNLWEILRFWNCFNVKLYYLFQVPELFTCYSESRGCLASIVICVRIFFLLFVLTLVMVD
jgi:hypothetical protein